MGVLGVGLREVSVRDVFNALDFTFLPFNLAYEKPSHRFHHLRVETQLVCVLRSTDCRTPRRIPSTCCIFDGGTDGCRDSANLPPLGAPIERVPRHTASRHTLAFQTRASDTPACHFMSRKMAAFTLTNARALLTNPITASVGGRAAKAAVCNASRSSVPALARVVVPARSFGGLAVSGVAQSRATVVRAFHFTAMSMDEEGGDSAGATEGPVKLYVGNLSWGVDDASLGDMFADFSASDMTVVKDNESGRSRGFGFVTLTNQAEADKAIAALDGMVRTPPPIANHSCPDPNTTSFDVAGEERRFFGTILVDKSVAEKRKCDKFIHERIVHGSATSSPRTSSSRTVNTSLTHLPSPPHRTPKTGHRRPPSAREHLRRAR